MGSLKRRLAVLESMRRAEGFGEPPETEAEKAFREEAERRFLGSPWVRRWIRDRRRDTSAQMTADEMRIRMLEEMIADGWRPTPRVERRMRTPLRELR